MGTTGKFENMHGGIFRNTHSPSRHTNTHRPSKMQPGPQNNARAPMQHEESFVNRVESQLDQMQTIVINISSSINEIRQGIMELRRARTSAHGNRANQGVIDLTSGDVSSPSRIHDMEFSLHFVILLITGHVCPSSASACHAGGTSGPYGSYTTRTSRTTACGRLVARVDQETPAHR